MSEIQPERWTDGRLTEVLHFPDNHLAVSLFGEHDAHLDFIEKQLDVTIHPRGNTVTVVADEDKLIQTVRLLNNLYRLLEQGQHVDVHRIEDSIRLLWENHNPVEVFSKERAVCTPRRTIHPRGANQATYIQMLRTLDITFAEGPAGTGKTYLGVAVAVAMLLENRIARIVLTRPAVEAGEQLGFLPGDLQAKVDPYLKPLYDALYEILGFEKVDKMLDQNRLEIAPLAYMRGRTLSNSFVILDEAQNTTPEQMKMFLTRLGVGSKAVIAGDTSQIDLANGQLSGMSEALSLLRDIEGIGFSFFAERDSVRHSLVQEILLAYSRHKEHSST